MLRRMHLAYYRHREKFWALNGTLSLPIEAYYHDLLCREGDAAHIGERSSVLFVGAGATPYTPVVLAEQFGCEVTAVDKDRTAIVLARHYLARKSPHLPVTAVYGTGEDVDVSDFDVVMLALHAAPKRRILEHLSAEISTQARVVVRDPWGPWRDLYEPMPDPGEVGLRVEATIPRSGTYRFESLILRKADSRL